MKFKLDLKSEKKRLKVTMPAEASNANRPRIVVNGKEIGSSLETDNSSCNTSRTWKFMLSLSGSGARNEGYTTWTRSRR